MTNRGDELAELSAALDVTPPSSFADGVRARVAQSRARARQMWWGLAAAATVTLATAVMWRPATESPTAAQVAPTQAARITQPVPPPVTNVTPALTRRVSPVARVAASASSEPRLEVITNQGAILRELWAGVSVRDLSEVVVEAQKAEPLAPMVPPAPITVDPIVVAPIVVSEIGKEAGRGGAIPVIRRVEATKETR